MNKAFCFTILKLLSGKCMVFKWHQSPKKGEGNPLLSFTVLPFGDALQGSFPVLSVSIIHGNEFYMLLVSFS